MTSLLHACAAMKDSTKNQCTTTKKKEFITVNNAKINYKILGATLKHYREMHGVSVKDFYKISGISEDRISKLESGKSNTSLKTIERYAFTLKMNISDFVIEYELKKTTSN